MLYSGPIGLILFSYSEIRPLAVSWEYLKPRPDDQTAYEVEIRERRIERQALYEIVNNHITYNIH